MQLWWHWYSMVAPLRMACARQRSFCGSSCLLPGSVLAKTCSGSVASCAPWGSPRAVTTGYWISSTPRPWMWIG
jgi:hypothetical protein